MKIRFRISLLLATATAAMTTILASAPVATLNAVTPSGTHSLQDGVAYGPLARKKLDIYIPAYAALAGGWPVVVFFYKGSWNRGDRAQYRFVGEAFTSRGVLTYVADYRLYPEVRHPEFLVDCAQALTFGLQGAAKLGGNPTRLFVIGHSAGAYNAAVGTRPPMADHDRPRPDRAGRLGRPGRAI
jgi:acetyl esterase/lipase